MYLPKRTLNLRKRGVCSMLKRILSFDICYFLPLASFVRSIRQKFVPLISDTHSIITAAVTKLFKLQSGDIKILPFEHIH